MKTSRYLFLFLFLFLFAFLFLACGAENGAAVSSLTESGIPSSKGTVSQADFSVTLSLEEEGKRYTSEFSLTPLEEGGDSHFSMVVTVLDEKGTILQTLEEPEIFTSYFHEQSDPISEGRYYSDSFRVEDVNFDGAPDIVYPFSAVGRSDYYGAYRWDKAAGKFISTNFQEICNPEVNGEKRRIEGHGSGGWNVNGLEEWDFQGDRFILKADLTRNYDEERDDDSLETLTERRLQNGQLETTFFVALDSPEAARKCLDYFEKNTEWNDRFDAEDFVNIFWTTNERINPSALPPAPAASGNAPAVSKEKADLSSLSSEAVTWGPGVAVDSAGRPVAPVQLQEKYGFLGAYFIAPESKNVILTFDEGYENGLTPSILDTLREKKVSATFFVTMDFVKDNPQLVQRIIDEGHILGNHSVHHKNMTTLPDDVATEEIMGLHRYVKEHFGYEMWLFRPPEGAFSQRSLGVAHNAGYLSVFWSFAYRDWEVDNQMAAADALPKVIGKLHGGAIYLLHAVSSTNAEILGQFIDEARGKGYTFSPFTLPDPYETNSMGDKKKE